MVEGVHDAVLELAASEQVRVADVGDRVAGVWVLTERLHGSSLSPVVEQGEPVSRPVTGVRVREGV
jgi:hypothetical protein